MAGESAAKRQRLFDLFVNQPGHEDLTRGRYFWCPLCRKQFVREDCIGDTPKLTLAHIVPASQGGTWKTLSCAECNNGNGAKIETDFLTMQQMADWAKGRGAIRVRMEGQIKAEMSRNSEDNSTHIKILTPMISPAVAAHKEKLINAKSGDEFKIQMPWFRIARCKATLCQSAYLLMFKYFGYDFAWCGTYNPILNQIRDPSKDHQDVLTCQVPSDMAGRLLGEKQAGVFLVSEPVKCILAVMRFTSPSKADQFEAVAMPGPQSTPLIEFTASGMLYAPVEDNAEVNGRWEHSFGEEWWRCLRIVAA